MVRKLVMIIFAVVIVSLILLFVSLNKSSPATVKTVSSLPSPYIPSCFSQGPNISVSPGATYECVLAYMPTGNCGGVYISLNLTSSMPVNVEMSDENGYVLYQWSGMTYINQEIKLVNPSSYSDNLYLIIHNPNGYTANVYLSYTEYRGCSS